jgi:hypothetical protein
MEQNQILEAKVKALEELVEIQSKTIETLKNQPTKIEIQYVPNYQYYYYPYYQHPYWVTYGQQGYAQQGGSLNSQSGAGASIQSVQVNQQSGMNQAYL